jgi:radical SAM-linked protein
VRVRLRFSKLGKIRFTSQRDVARMWERALRRGELPMAYTRGFSPRPQLSFGLALPTCCESLAEYVDVLLDDERPETARVDPFALPEHLSQLLPDGIDVQAAKVVDGGSASLQQEVSSCSWSMTLGGLGRSTMEARVTALLAAPDVPILRERKGREEVDDLRPSVVILTIEGKDGSDDGPVELVAELKTRPRGVRPIELVRGLAAMGHAAPGGDSGVGGDPELVRACRTKQWIECDGVRREPLPNEGESPDADRAVCALGRAS